jgi:hypothetical protein
MATVATGLTSLGSLALGPKLVVGGLGGITPLVLHAYFEVDSLLVTFASVVAIGYVLKALLLFFLGAAVAFIQKNETSLQQIFVIGISAPAILTAAIAGNQLREEKRNNSAPQRPPATSARFAPGSDFQFNLPDDFYAETARVDGTGGKVAGRSSPAFAAQAQANPCANPNALPVFALPEETTAEQVRRGFLGLAPTRVWFVIAGSSPTCQGAAGEALHLTYSGVFERSGLDYRLYRPSDHFPDYAVVLGDPNLTLDEAEAVRATARSAGHSDAYLYRVRG